MMPAKYVNGPPVVVINSPGEREEICTEFINEVNKFGPPAERPGLSWWQRLRTPKKVIIEQQKTEWFERQLWLAQKKQPELEAESIRKMAFSYDYTFCAYKPDKVVGLMCWSAGVDKGRVEYLTMLPGYESHGTILVEYAVKLSNEAGYRGRTHFKQFKALAYKPRWLKYLKSATVDPQESDDWDELDGEWWLKGQEKSFSSRLTKSARNIHNPDLL